MAEERTKRNRFATDKDDTVERGAEAFLGVNQRYLGARHARATNTATIGVPENASELFGQRLGRRGTAPCCFLWPKKSDLSKQRRWLLPIERRQGDDTNGDISVDNYGTGMFQDWKSTFDLETMKRTRALAASRLPTHSPAATRRISLWGSHGCILVSNKNSSHRSFSFQ